MGTDKQGKPGNKILAGWKAAKVIGEVLAIIVSIISIGQAIFGSSESSGNTTSLEDSSQQGVLGQITSENTDGQNINFVTGDSAQIVVQNPETPTSNENSSELDEITIATSGMTQDEKLAFSSDRIRSGEYAQAAHVLSSMLGENITDAQMLAVIYHNRGLAHFYLGEYALSRLDFEQAITSKEFSDAYYNLGVVHHYAYSEYKQAIDAYSKALDYEENVVYRLARAVAYERDGQFQAALHDYLAVLDADSQNTFALEGKERMTQAS